MKCEQCGEREAYLCVLCEACYDAYNSNQSRHVIRQPCTCCGRIEVVYMVGGYGCYCIKCTKAMEDMVRPLLSEASPDAPEPGEPQT